MRKRSENEGVSENLRNCINAFLYRTGSPSHKVMVVLATNLPEALDVAVKDRIDEVLLFSKPNLTEREALLRLYVGKYFKNKEDDLLEKFRRVLEAPSRLWKQEANIDATVFDAALVSEVAGLCEGLSAREMSKLVLAFYDKAFARDEVKLTRKEVDEVVEKFLKQRRIVRDWDEVSKI